MESVLREAIKDVLAELELNQVDFTVEHPGDFSHGDYASNVAMVVAKEAGINPRELAEKIVQQLTDQIEYLDKIEVAGPGFINFYLSRDFFTREVARVAELGTDWGRHNTLEGKTVLLEYTSPNLFKPLHVGNLVGNIVGESVSRLFETAGATVQRLNYPSDIGLTVAKGVWGLQNTKGNPADIEAIGQAYVVGNEAYEKGGEDKEAIEAVNRALYAGDNEELNSLREQGIATSRAHLNALLVQLGTTFDKEITESEASPVGTKIVQDNIGRVFEESDGATVFLGEKVGLHTRVFLNSQGLPTYEAKDVGNFSLKLQTYPDWDYSLVVTGSEQTEYFKVIYAAIKELWPSETKDKSLEHIATGFLTLSTGKMSSRKGNVLTGETILSELKEAAHERAKETRAEDIYSLSTKLAVAALKYQILRQKVGSDIVFDKERALSFEGDSGPYLQYTNARINSLLVKAHEANIEPAYRHTTDTPYLVEKYLYQFPEVVAQAQEERAPHHLVTYLTELAGAFNTFYATEKVADATDEYAPYKMAITEAVGQTLKNGLWMLGFESPEQM